MCEEQTCQPSMFSPEDSHARTYQWPESVLGSLVTDLASGTSSPESSLKQAPPGWSLKMSLASCRQTEDGTWVPSSGRWGTMGMGSPGVCWTLNGSEWPSDAAVCSLSDILEATAHPKYSLSARAAQGLIRRSSRRGKNIPEPLLSALMAIVESVEDTKTI